MARAKRRQPGLAAALLVGALALGVLAPAARAGDRIYWVNNASNTISFASLDGSEGGPFDTTGVPVSKPNGLAIDPGAQQLYWVNSEPTAGAKRISFASLFGLGGELFETGELSIVSPNGLAIDPAGERIYWADNVQVDFASLDGSFGAKLGNTGAATVASPSSVAADPSAGRVYWANALSSHAVSFANLDGSGGGDVNVAGASVTVPVGVAIDHRNERVYWANSLGDTISFANLDGSGGGDLSTGAATVAGPRGLAIDPAGGRLYWANRQADKLSFANLDGSGGGDLKTTGTTPSAPEFPVLLFTPRPSAPPKVTGQPRVGAVLSCSSGAWAADAPEAFLYQAPQSFRYQWSREGAEIPGATGITLTASSAEGAYVCRVTARNRAGETSQTSAPFRVLPVAFGKDTRVTLKLASRRVPAKGPVAIRVANANPFPVTGTLSAAAHPAGKGKGGKAAKPFKVAAGSKAVVKLSLPGAWRRALARRGELSIALSASVADPTGNRRVVKKTVLPRADR